MAELRSLFAGFLAAARKVVVNLDDPESRMLGESVPGDKLIGYGFDSPAAAFQGKAYEGRANGSSFALEALGERYQVELAVPGRHNASNALAAIATTYALGVRVEDAASALRRFEGLKRRLETVGEAAGVTVIDDFAHNPDKIDATLATMRDSPGRLLVMFQPHGFGPIAKMGEELAESLAKGLRPSDRLYLPDPVYQGGTTDRSRGSDWLAAAVAERGGTAVHIAGREALGEALIEEARDGDRVLIMGARDDTLIDFARSILEGIESWNQRGG